MAITELPHDVIRSEMACLMAARRGMTPSEAYKRIGVDVTPHGYLVVAYAGRRVQAEITREQLRWSLHDFSERLLAPMVAALYPLELQEN